MQFNIKLKEYTETGTATITIYDDLVGVPDNIEIERSNKKSTSNVIYELNPFSGQYEEMELIVDEEEKFHREQENLQHS